MEILKNIPFDIKVCQEFDVCVVGGGVTGVFAAVKAARLGAKTALIERGNCLGGVACAGLVNIWHSLYDIDYKNQIIAGLTYETEQRLEKCGGAMFEKTDSAGIRFDPNMLKCILDDLVCESGIKLYLHTAYSGILCDGDTLKYALISNKDGFSAIKASFFIDATGDGDIMRDLKIPCRRSEKIQPPTSCFYLSGKIHNSLDELIKNHGREFGLDDDWGWYSDIPGFDNITLRADNHVFNVDCSKADDLTYAEIMGRKKAEAFASLLRRYDNPECRIASMCSTIGIRETVHYETNFCANETDLLCGKRYEDAVLNGTYRIDIHHSEDNGITFKYLDGRYESIYGKNERSYKGNWREEAGLTGDCAKYYQVPFKILVQNSFRNVIAAGRMINADDGAFGALRVMVNLNQLGEAAGAAAYLCLNGSKPIGGQNGIDGTTVRRLLKAEGSAL